MHFRAQLTVELNEPLPCEGLQPFIGYIIVIGVNAPDIATATKYAHDVALRPRQADGSYRSFQGVVTGADVQRIEITDWEPLIQQNAKRINEEGVYYSTGLIFFPKDE